MILITSYYRTESEDRNKEMDFVLEKNIKSSLFDKIILVCDSMNIPNIDNELIEVVKLQKRPEYIDFFNIGNREIHEGKIIVISNSDIFYDETIKESYNFLEKSGFLALTRYEYDIKDDSSIMIMGCDSQDSWVYRSPIETSGIDANFGMGIPGCDNRIAYEISKKYKVINPSKTIKTYHRHESDYRTYDPNNRLSGGILQVHIE